MPNDDERNIRYASQIAGIAVEGLMETFDLGLHASKGAARRAAGEPTPPMKPTKSWHQRILDGLAGAYPK